MWGDWFLLLARNNDAGNFIHDAVCIRSLRAIINQKYITFHIICTHTYIKFTIWQLYIQHRSMDISDCSFNYYTTTLIILYTSKIHAILPIVDYDVQTILFKHIQSLSLSIFILMQILIEARI